VKEAEMISKTIIEAFEQMIRIAKDMRLAASPSFKRGKNPSALGVST
jgi:hypothetical protein